MIPDYTYDAKIIRVVDGDTYEVEVDLGFRIVARLPLRLAHVDTPERNTAAGKSVIKYLLALFGPLPTSVYVRTYKPVDKYGRYLADVYVPSTSGPLDLGQSLVEQGLAKSYEGGKKE